mgnify:CR=1 FL=1
MSGMAVDIGSRIATWRTAKGLTRRELAEAIGITPPAVYQWEDGTTMPSTTNLAAVADALGLTMAKFYGRLPTTKVA